MSAVYRKILTLSRKCRRRCLANNGYSPPNKSTSQANWEESGGEISPPAAHSKSSATRQVKPGRTSPSVNLSSTPNELTSCNERYTSTVCVFGNTTQTSRVP